MLSVIIIARNEEAHIAHCIESIVAGSSGMRDCEVVLVDSRSEDRTVEIASAYPIRIVELSEASRCCPALGRHVGSRSTRGRYVHFVDGDTTIDVGWLRAAVDVLERNSDVAGVGGREDQVYYREGTIIGTKADYFGTGERTSEVRQLGGNGLYRRAALEEVGSFNPYVRSFEEAELGARLRKAGWRLWRVPVLMGHHHTPKPEALDEYWRRFRSHLLTGQGQVLRLSLGQGLFLEHLAQLNRLVLFLGWVLIGVTAGIGSLALADYRVFAAWMIVSVLLLVAFAVRSRSISKPFRLTMDWAISSIPFVWGCVLPVADPQGFRLEEAIASDRTADTRAPTVRASLAATAAPTAAPPLWVHRQDA
ncbi:MAG TPA: glycosyltransferase [Candidatus Dormibacteraeota bacterium]|nr:glycosyltransferase [Candidatus Dormibacteraeota bacterium]